MDIKGDTSTFDASLGSQFTSSRKTIVQIILSFQHHFELFFQPYFVGLNIEMFSGITVCRVHGMQYKIVLFSEQLLPHSFMLSSNISIEQVYSNHFIETKARDFCFQLFYQAICKVQWALP